MPIFIFGLILVLWANLALSSENIRIIFPQIIPEKEFAYLRNPILQFLRERLDVINLSSQEEKEIKVLISSFHFEPSGKAKIDLTLQKLSTGEPLFKRTYETSFEDFWKTLERGIEDIKAFSSVSSSVSNTGIKPLDKISHKTTTFTKEKPSFFSRINPINLLSKVIPKRENPLRISLEVPPPPPPTILSATNIFSQSPFLSSSQEDTPSFTPQRTPSQIPSKSTDNKPQSIFSPRSSSPWQWF